MHQTTGFGPVDTRRTRVVRLQTLPFAATTLTSGFWAHRQEINHSASLAHGYAMLEQAGNFSNLRIAAGWEQGAFRGRNFYDEDVYKWLEALGWELGRAPDAALQQMANEVIELIAAVQEPSGYLNSYYQTVEPGNKWADMDHGHELYCAGHLIQAAITFARACRDERLLRVVLRLVDHIDAVFGPGGRDETCGHPEIETALVELYRLTGDARHLALAQLFIDRRGRNRMRGHAGYGADYHQDHMPVRDAQEVTGHAVRQLYLLTGVADLYMETGEPALLESMQRLWQDMTARKMYITGGIGSRFDGESFGAPYELPPDTCYCETCAAIGSLMWNWRLLLVTGDARYADLFERTLYNAVLASPGLEGRSFLYANPLQVRSGRYVRASTDVSDGAQLGRPAWHYVACCPPNVMRLLASLAHYCATTDDTGVQIHQFSPLNLQASPGGRAVQLTTESNFPWEGQVRVRIEQADGGAWTLQIRRPGWCSAATLRLNGRPLDLQPGANGYYAITRAWAAGDLLELDLAMEARFVAPHPRVDAVRGCVALERGPLVYCFEQHDQPRALDLLDAAVDTTQPIAEEWAPDGLGGIVRLRIAGSAGSAGAWPVLYQPLEQAPPRSPQGVALTAIPYFAWANRGMESMRVWIPQAAA